MDRALSAGDLAELLSGVDPETPVVLGYPSGDYWGHEIANPVSKVKTSAYVEYSAYHEKLRLLKDSRFDDEDESVEVVYLR